MCFIVSINIIGLKDYISFEFDDTVLKVVPILKKKSFKFNIESKLLEPSA